MIFVPLQKENPADMTTDNYEIIGRNKPVYALVQVPGSKSISNRALLTAAFGRGKCTLENLIFSDDSRHMLQCLRDLGVKLLADEKKQRVELAGVAGNISPDCPALGSRKALYVGNAGTAARFLPCLCAAMKGDFYFDSDPRMRERPMDEVLQVLAEQGAEILDTNGKLLSS